MVKEKVIQSHENCLFFKIDPGIRKLGICTAPSSGIDVTNSITVSLCPYCKIWKKKVK
jgi:hypothetical protein